MGGGVGGGTCHHDTATIYVFCLLLPLSPLVFIPFCRGLWLLVTDCTALCPQDAVETRTDFSWTGHGEFWTFGFLAWLFSIWWSCLALLPAVLGALLSMRCLYSLPPTACYLHLSVSLSLCLPLLCLPFTFSVFAFLPPIYAAMPSPACVLYYILGMRACILAGRQACACGNLRHRRLRLPAYL